MNSLTGEISLRWIPSQVSQSLSVGFHLSATTTRTHLQTPWILWYYGTLYLQTSRIMHHAPSTSRNHGVFTMQHTRPNHALQNIKETKKCWRWCLGKYRDCNTLFTAVSEAPWIVEVLQWKIGFKSLFFLFEVQKASSLFCLVQNGPGVTLVTCIGLRERS